MVYLFGNEAIPPVAPSEWLLASLNKAYLTLPTNEKAKSERLVSPILLEILEAFQTEVSFFSGEEVNINAQDDLAGPCDFFFTLIPNSPYLELPIISIVEAKDEDLDWGIAQCAAQVYAANLMNTSEGKDMPVLYGCTTTGTEWLFFRFENNTFYVDKKPIADLPTVLGIWHWILNYYKKLNIQ
jgi:hypothetical protein